MNKKATFTAAVLLAMGSTGAVTASQVPSANGSLNIPLPGTIEYESASKLVNESLIVANKKRPPVKKKKFRDCTIAGRTVAISTRANCPPSRFKKA